MLMRLIIVIFLMSTLSFCAKNKENVYEPSKLLDPYKLYIEGLEAFKTSTLAVFLLFSYSMALSRWLGGAAVGLIMAHSPCVSASMAF